MESEYVYDSYGKIKKYKIKPIDEWAIEAEKQHCTYGELQARETCELLRSQKRIEERKNRLSVDTSVSF